MGSGYGHPEIPARAIGVQGPTPGSRRRDPSHPMWLGALGRKIIGWLGSRLRDPGTRRDSGQQELQVVAGQVLEQTVVGVEDGVGEVALALLELEDLLLDGVAAD